MKQTHAEDIYLFYQQFAEEFILKGNSILTDDKDILSVQTIQNCFKYYVDNFKSGSESFGEKVTEQFKEADAKTKLVFAHAEWLWAFAVDDITLWRKKELTKRTTGITDESTLKDIYPVGFGSAGMYHIQQEKQFINRILNSIN